MRISMRRRKGDRYKFTVEGHGQFPYDMLRHDSCWPCDEGRDSPQLSYHETSGQPGPRRVVLQSASESGPTPARWESFGWLFVGEDEMRDPTTHPTPPRGTYR